MTFKKTLLAAALAASSMGALAQTADASKDAPETAPSLDWAVTANVSLVSEYRFRGIAQTFGQPAIQGGFDISMPYGFYVGNWNSNVASGAGYPGGNLEMDFYGGWKHAFNEDFGLDTGVLWYLYPGSKGGFSPFTMGDNAGYSGVNNGMVNNFEYYIGGNWKTVNLKQFVSFTDYFGQISPTGGSTAGSGYTDLTATQDLGFIDPSLSTWGVVGHVGYLAVSNYTAANYVDWKLGITKDFGNGWLASASYIQTNANGNCSKYSDGSSTQPYCLTKTWDTNGNFSGGPRNLGNATGVVQITKTF